MTFLLPLGLLALLTLPVIVLLHLIRERRPRRTVPSLLLWPQPPRRPEGVRARRLPLTLLLLLHLLVAALLALALARPQLPGLPGRGAAHTAIILDSSTSMAARDGAGTRLDAARQRALALLRAMDAGDRATLIAAGPEARVLAAGGPGALPLLQAALDSLRPAGAGADLDGALTLAEAALAGAPEPRIVVLTDGAGPPIAPRAVAAPVEWQTVGGAAPNRAIVAFAARPFGNTVRVYARLANPSPGPFTTETRLFADDALVERRLAAINADGETELTWSLPAGAKALRLEIDGRDALPEDDRALLNLAAARPLDILLVSARPDALRRALAAVGGARVAVASPVAYASGDPAARAADLTVLDGVAPDPPPGGALLLINPPAGAFGAGDRTAPTDGQPLRQEGALLAGLSFGGASFGPAREMDAPPWAATLLTSGATPLILRGNDGARDVAIWNFDLAQSSLPNRLAFPLLVARTVRDLTPGGLPQSLTAGEPLLLHPGPRVRAVELTGPDGATRQASGPAVAFDGLGQPGWYRVVERGDAGVLYEGRLAVNAGSPLEADLRPQAPPALTAAAPAPATAAAIERPRLELWPWLAALALGLLAMEWLYALRRRAA
jgi:hypothetical protein